MNFEKVLALITKITPLAVLKIFLILSLVFYVVFAWVLLRQEKFMSQVVEVPISPILALLVTIHFWTALGLFILALFVL